MLEIVPLHVASRRAAVADMEMNIFVFSGELFQPLLMIPLRRLQLVAPRGEIGELAGERGKRFLRREKVDHSIMFRL